VDHFSFIPQNVTERRQNTYCVVAFLPSDLEELIRPLREKFDPLYNQVPSHLTLVFPFESRLPLNELAAQIKSVTDRASSVTVELESIGDFYPRCPVIYWAALRSPQLVDLYAQLNQRLDQMVAPLEYKPHVTVAREISPHRVMLVKDRIAGYLPQERFVASRLDLISPLHGYRWVSVRTFPLARDV
jgi:2'-5' RNA ligase